jgi:hypothetical protein
MAWPKSFHPVAVIQELKRKLASQLEQERERWQQERERLPQENEKLKRQLEETQRASKRRRHRSLAVEGNRSQTARAQVRHGLWPASSQTHS